MMDITFADLVQINAILKERGLRYRVGRRDAQTGSLEPPGECCITHEREQGTRACIREYFAAQGSAVQFSEDGMYFSVREAGRKAEGPPACG